MRGWRRCRSSPRHCVCAGEAARRRCWSSAGSCACAGRGCMAALPKQPPALRVCEYTSTRHGAGTLVCVCCPVASRARSSACAAWSPVGWQQQAAPSAVSVRAAVAEQANGEWHRGCRAGHWRVAPRLQSRPLASRTAAAEQANCEWHRGRHCIVHAPRQAGAGGPPQRLPWLPISLRPLPRIISPAHVHNGTHTHVRTIFRQLYHFSPRACMHEVLAPTGCCMQRHVAVCCWCLDRRCCRRLLTFRDRPTPFPLAPHFGFGTAGGEFTACTLKKLTRPASIRCIFMLLFVQSLMSCTMQSAHPAKTHKSRQGFNAEPASVCRVCSTKYVDTQAPATPHMCTCAGHTAYLSMQVFPFTSSNALCFGGFGGSGPG